MERIPLSPKTDSDLVSVLNQMMDEALGQPIDLSGLSGNPTTAGEEVKEGQWGIRSSKLYFTILGTTYSISLTAT